MARNGDWTVTRKRPPQNEYFCLAPWTHTFISPQSERRICCASREKAEFVHQYIDRPGAQSQAYSPSTLDEHWNSEKMMSVRRRIMAGERIPECEVCNDKLLNLDTYRQYFKWLFGKYTDAAFENTDDRGFTTLKPVSFDYRLSNACNFKCRMCGAQLSSAWETERREMQNWSPTEEPWMSDGIRLTIQSFQKEVVEKELESAALSGKLEEIYWVGGEPLMWPLHWKLMKALVDRGHSQKVYLRYNTNLSVVERAGVHLFKDLLPHFRDYQICASIDGTGKIGEWIRTGLKWDRFLANFKEGLCYSDGHPERMMLDVTLTLPGLFSVKDLLDLSNELQVRMLVKVVFAFDPSILLSPLALPRSILDNILDELIQYCEPKTTDLNRPMLETLKSLKTRPTFEESFPESYKQGFREGRERLQKLAEFRQDPSSVGITLEEIYSKDHRVSKWWQS